MYDLKYTTMLMSKFLFPLDSIETKKKLVGIIREICEEKNIDFLEFDTSTYRLYLTLSVGPDVKLSELIGYIMQRSSKGLSDNLGDLEEPTDIWEEEAFVVAGVVSYYDMDIMVDAHLSVSPPEDDIVCYYSWLISQEDIEDEPEEEPVTRLRVVNS
jgi:hypothetical protein